ncbi:hypothetical protein [Stenotrophomonas sp. MMGLT7]|uniref:hypothetical protein n=1 Tax=Stenotrophomonas sp. MMGLT7 TaxID=2901227 RepID=UPI001E4E11EB|nr:hypothetical protein [Stenotrophomonas sp. MMGLT7]MCD7099519.1 hypothetical protein [Stenotrophomonas sp. MMGLT7]
MHRVTFAQARPHIVAGIATCLILAAMLHVLLKLPAIHQPGRTESRMRLVLLARGLPPERPQLPRPSSPRPSANVAPAGGTSHAVSKSPPRIRADTATRADTPAEALTNRLYTADGRVRMAQEDTALPSAAPGRPPGSAGEGTADSGKRLMERPNPIDYRQTRFDKDWASDGNLMQVADQALTDAMKKLRPKSGAAPAVARPPPDVRFNPALHESSAELGSEATGDAYKAAPIAFEKAPDLKGGASGRIRQSLAETESRYARCGGERIRTLLVPALAHLRALESVEYAMANGADPIRAANLLPRQADSAYDLARRAVWYAQSKLEACK